MKVKLIAGLFVCLTTPVALLQAAPGASAAGPNDLDRFRHQTPVTNRTSFATNIPGVAAKFRLLLSQGSSALQAKQYDLAISRFTAALQMNPDKNTASVVYNFRSRAYIHKQQLDKALEDANAAMRLNPGYYDPYVARGLVYRFRGNLDKAISEYNTAIQLNPNAFLAYNNRGIAYSRKAQEERAIQDFNEAIRLNSNYADGYMNRGTSYEALGNLDRAMADYGEAIRRNPRVENAHYNRGRLSAAMGHSDRAITDLTETIRQGGEATAYAYEIRARVYDELGRLAEAAADYDHAIRAAPKNAAGYITRGDAYFAKGDDAAAASNYAKAKQMAPNDGIVLSSVAWFKATCPNGSFRNGGDAVQESMKACGLTKWKNWNDLDTLAAASAETGDFDKALKYETQALNQKGVPAGTRKKMQDHLRMFQQHKPWREESKLRRSRN